MRYFLTIFIILISNLSYAQRVEFRFYVKNPCNGEVRLDSLYILDNSDGKHLSIDKPIVILPDTGTYFLYRTSYSPDCEFESLKITIHEFGNFNYYHLANKIQVRTESGPLLYEKCGELLNGFYSDSFPNGKLRLYGNFKEGYIRDSLVYFFPNGHAKSRIFSLRKITKVLMYDSLSNLISVSFNSNKSYLLTDYKKTEYFVNGKIKLIEAREKLILKKLEYFPDGSIKIKQTRNKRVEYSKKGMIDLIYHRRRAFKYKGQTDKQKVYSVIKKSYNENGDLIKIEQYKGWVYDYDIPDNYFSRDGLETIIEINNDKIYEK